MEPDDIERLHLALQPDGDPERLADEELSYIGITRGESSEYAAWLVAEGFVVLGGPVGQSDGDEVVLVVSTPTPRLSRNVSRATPGSEPFSS